MKEGEPVLGGVQAVPGNAAASNIGQQPISPATPATPQTDFSSFQSGTQTGTPSISAPTQPISPTRPQSVPRLTNRFSDRATLSQSSQAPIINNVPQNMQFVQPVPQPDSYASDIMSSPAPQPKKSKKWIAIVLILLTLAGIGVGAAMFIPTLLAGPIQEVTEEQYLELYDCQSTLNEADKIIETGVENNLSIYELILADYLAENDESLNEVFLNETAWESKYNISTILQKTPDGVTKLENTINSMSGVNYVADIKEMIKKINDNLSKYSAVLKTFIEKLSSFKTAFINRDGEKIKELIGNEDIALFVVHRYTDFFDIYTTWNQCIQSNNSTSCAEMLDQEKIKSLINDTKTVKEVFNIFLNEEDLAVIKDTSDYIKQLIKLIDAKEREKNHEE